MVDFVGWAMKTIPGHGSQTRLEMGVPNVAAYWPRLHEPITVHALAFNAVEYIVTPAFETHAQHSITRHGTAQRSTEQHSTAA